MRMPIPHYSRPAEDASPEQVTRWMQMDVRMDGGSAKCAWLSQLLHDLFDRLSDRAKRTALKISEVALGVSRIINAEICRRSSCARKEQCKSTAACCSTASLIKMHTRVTRANVVSTSLRALLSVCIECQCNEAYWIMAPSD